MSKGWIGVDLDGTLAYYESGMASNFTIGPPIEPMLIKVKNWISNFQEVRIMTARVSGTPSVAHLARKEIEKWCLKHLGVILPVTHEKDYDMLVLYDDRAVSVERNTGKIFGGPEVDHLGNFKEKK